MNFPKLFAAGKGLIGMRSATSPYRMKPGGGLPKFGSPKNPFSPPVSSESPKPALCKPEAVSEKVPAPAPLTTGTVKLETASLFAAKPVEAPAPMAAEVEKTVILKCEVTKSNLPPNQPVQPELRPAAPALPKPARKRLQVGELMKKLNPLTLLPARQPGAARSRTPRPAVQGELSLEKVKVVRNDLSDTDLEIVPVRSAMKLSPSRGTAVSVPIDEATAWDRLTSRFFNTEETQVR
jgi:hypothetical protein